MDVWRNTYMDFIMKLFVAGSRSITNPRTVERIIEGVIKNFIPESLEEITIISGGAIGVDSIAEDWARRNTTNEPIIVRPRYDLFGSMKAPLERNTTLVDMCDGAIVIWDGQPGKRGTGGGTIDVRHKMDKTLKPLWFFTVPLQI